MSIKRNLFRDVLRDTNSKKYSMTKVAAFVTLILVIIAVSTGIWIMIVNKDVDHILIGELIALLLTLLGFKNAKKNNENKQKQLVANKETFIDENDILSKEDNDEIG